MKKNIGIIVLALLVSCIAMAEEAGSMDELLAQIDRHQECLSGMETISYPVVAEDGESTVIHVKGLKITLAGKQDEIPMGTHLKSWRDEESGVVYIKTATLERIKVLKIEVSDYGKR